MKRMQRFLVLCMLSLCLAGAASATDYDGYLVKLNPDAPARLLDALTTAASRAIPPTVEEVYAPAGLYRVQDAAAVERLRKSGALLYAEPNYIVTIDDTPELDDSDVSLLDAAADSEERWYEAPLGMEVVRRKGVTGEGVRVGIVDSGIFRNHEEFEGVTILDGANYCVSEGDAARGDVSDRVGHGTFVSGLIAAARNGKGIVGLAPDVELVPLKAFESRNGAISNIAAAIYDSVDTWHCQVLNLSLGVTQDYDTLRDAIEYAADHGVLMVAAAGNLTSGGEHREDGDPLNYPAAYSQVIGVGAVGLDLSVASFSFRNESVEVSAPGQNMRAPSTAGASRYSNGYGTSYAAPLVTAAAALALSVHPGLTIDEFRNLLLQTARDLGPEGYDTAYGNGLLQVGQLCAVANPERMASIVTWRNYDGTILQTVSGVAPGTLPAYDGETPVRDGYTFDYWKPAPEAVTDDADYTAHFTPDAAAILSAVAEGDALNVTLMTPGDATLVASYFDENERFLNVCLTPVEASAETAILPLWDAAQTARVILFGDDYRPLCASFETPLAP